MTSDRKKPTAGFWITVAVVAVLVAYPLSFGLVARMHRNGWFTPRAIEVVRWLYFPIGWLEVNGPEPIRRAIFRYEQLWIGE